MTTRNKPNNTVVVHTEDGLVESEIESTESTEGTPDLDNLINEGKESPNGVSEVDSETTPSATVKPKTEVELAREHLAMLEKQLILARQHVSFASLVDGFLSEMNLKAKTLTDSELAEMPKTTVFHVFWDKDKVQFTSKLNSSAVTYLDKEAEEEVIEYKAKITKVLDMSQSELDTLNSKRLSRQTICTKLGIEQPEKCPNPLTFCEEVQKLVGVEKFTFEKVAK